MKKLTLSMALLSSMFLAQAQEKPQVDLEKQNWFHADYATDSIYGVASAEAYAYAAQKGLMPSPVTVAVIDSGIDVEHEDLADIIWVNEKEIPGNGIDDDQNGYIDDVKGWNFIGGKDAEVDADNLEITRLVREGKAKFETVDAATNQLNQEQFPEEYEAYKKIKIEFEKDLAEAKQGLAMMNSQVEGMKMAFNEFGKEYGLNKVITVEGLKAFAPQGQMASQMKMSFESLVNTPQAPEVFGRTPQEFLDEIDEQAKEGLKYYGDQVEFQYNLDFDPRNIVGDNYADKSEKYYGNNRVEGPDALHGTHVAGIIGAINDNGIGMNGVAKDVKILTVRTVPNGDERDKDVAHSIRYAVDNGAKIINMSFGKAYSPEKDLVWDAIKYATEKGVLLVHAAGNDNKDIDTESNYPTNYNQNGEMISDTWLTVGASTRYNDKIKASFSNLGKKQVDIFAPGLEIYSTIPDDKYKYLKGTSMAAPVVSGVAALVWSYFPTLSASELRTILIKSGNAHPDLMSISTDGVVVDALKAMKMAEETVMAKTATKKDKKAKRKKRKRKNKKKKESK